MRRIIIMGILFLVATVCASRIVVPQAKAAANLTISKNGYYDSASQNYYFFGEVKNVGTAAATDISISIVAYNSSNNMLYTGTCAPEITVLNAGAKSPFYTVYQDQHSQSVDHFDATIQSSSASTGLPVGIQITVDNTTLNGASSTITGTLQNTGTIDIDATEIYATYYDSNGTVIGIGRDQATALSPNDITNLNITSIVAWDVPFMSNANVTGYTITAESFVGQDNGDYISAETNGGTVPEFPSVFAILLVLTAISAIVLFSKKQQIKPSLHLT